LFAAFYLNHPEIKLWFIKNRLDYAGQTETISMNSLAPGFYIARVTCEGEAAQQKVVKR